MNAVLLQHDLRIEPYEYQREGIAFGLEKQRVLIGDEPGLGKSESLNSLIQTVEGEVLMRDIRIGDRIFGADGNVYNVIGIYPQGVLKTYRVTFSDGSSVVCSADHLWNVRDENRRRRNHEWKTCTLQEIIDNGLYLKASEKRIKSGRRPVPKWEIPMCQPVRYPEQMHLIPAYTMGAILGDGDCHSASHVLFSLPAVKQGIASAIEKELPAELQVKSREYSGITHYRIVNDCSDIYHTPNPYMQEIKCLGLRVKSGDKFIPKKYLLGSVEQRKALLAGLMDTDGSCTKNKTAFHTTSRRLALDVKKLVQSLGGIAKLAEYDRRQEGKKLEYRLNIKTTFNPFRHVLYKADAWRENKVFKVTRYITSVEYECDQECQCIKTSAPDELYLTEEFIVTHNTLQSIGIVNGARAYPCLVICPSSLKINWQREFEKFTDKRALVLSNSVQTSWPYMLQMGMFNVAIVNYESLRKYFVWDINGDKKSFRLKDVVFADHIKIFKSVIIDESHRVKDPSAQQTIFTRGIVEGKHWRILLTGTPVVNSAQDLVAQLAILGRLGDFGGRPKFLTDYGENKNLEELSAKLFSTCMIRREKAKVLTQLPDKTRCDLHVEISNREEYDLADADLAAYLREYTECTDRDIRRKMRMEALVKFMTLRSLSAKGKVKQAVDFVKTFLANGKPLILFCSLKEVVDALQKQFPKAVRVTGRDSAAEKQAAVDAFQSGNAQLIICSIKAAGVGLTLTASSNVAFVEFPWTYADCCQCEDRAHRIGQVDNVTCYYLMGRNTIDPVLYSIIQKKKSIANQIMASDDDIPTDEMYFDELVQSYLDYGTDA